jgi:peptidoglycan/xylan/chitin deacetylase (PgdA/CDA1 family)
VKAILTYHSVDSSGSVISVDPSTFERHVRWLGSGAVTVVSLIDLLSLSDDRDAVAITFDDAFTNFRTEAWPRLEAHGLPVTLYVPTGFVGRTNEWDAIPGGGMPTLPILDWSWLARLQEAGVTLGAHSRAHPDLRRLDENRIRDEVWGSLDDIARETGRRPDTFAYPYGYWNGTAASVVRGACLSACTTELRTLTGREQPHLLPRLDVYYLRGPAVIEDFGRWTFKQYLQVRAATRTVGQLLRAR